MKKTAKTKPEKESQPLSAESLKQTGVTQIPKVRTRILGFDEVLHGGLPEKRTTLIKGSAGTGKTVLGLEFLYRSALEGEPAMFISFEETADVLRQNALSMGWDIPALEASDRFFLWQAQIDRNAVSSGQFSIDSLLAVIQGKAAQIGARRIMIDALDVLMRIFEDPNKERNEMYRLHDWLIEQQFTTILTAKAPRDSEHLYRYEFLDYMADCVLLLDLRVAQQVATRRLRVVKYRGSGFCSNEYPYIITERGNVVMPVSTMALMHQPLGEKISSGEPNLDEALGGGFHQASSVLVSGPTGSGKTTLAATFAEKACARGKRVLYASFEESQQAIVAAMLSPGIDLRPALKEGRIEFHTIMPEALVVEEHLYLILRKIEQFGPDHVIVDAISGCQRMGTLEAAFDFVARLVDMCKQRNITCVMTNQLESNEQHANISGIGISSTIDTLIMIRYFEADGRIQRDLVVVKSRGAYHSNRHHLYSITDDGIQISLRDNEGD